MSFRTNASPDRAGSSLDDGMAGVGLEQLVAIVDVRLDVVTDGGGSASAASTSSAASARADPWMRGASADRGAEPFGRSRASRRESVRPLRAPSPHSFKPA
jgi:hypothetical protein